MASVAGATSTSVPPLRRSSTCARPAPSPARVPARAGAVEDVRRRRRRPDLLGARRALLARHRPARPPGGRPDGTLKAPSSAHLFGTDNLGRDVFSRVLAGAATVLVIAPAATLLGLVGGTTLGLITGFYRGWVDDVDQPHRRCVPGVPADRHRRAGAGVARARHPQHHPRHRHHLHAADRPHGALHRTGRARARVRRRGPAARRARHPDHGVGDPAEHHRADHGRGHGPPRLRHLHGHDDLVPRARPPAIRRPTGGSRSPTAAPTCRWRGGW